MRPQLFLLLVPLTISVSSQSWCPPGATWTYTFSNGWTHEGSARFTYVGDTLVGGIIAKRIHQYAEGLAMGEPFTWDLEPFITAVDDRLVTFWNGSSYDTLYNFAASPGDHWRMAPDVFADGVLNVLDTGTTSIDGLSLKYLVTGNNGIPGDTILERLGALHRYMLPWTMFTLDAAGGPLRCYSDDDISYTAPDWNYGCMSFTDVVDLTGTDNIIIQPNPGVDHFTLQLPPGPHELSLFDPQGRLLLRQQLSEEQPVISTSSLPAGIYHIRIIDRLGRSSGQRWIKE